MSAYIKKLVNDIIVVAYEIEDHIMGGDLESMELNTVSTIEYQLAGAEEELRTAVRIIRGEDIE